MDELINTPKIVPKKDGESLDTPKNIDSVITIKQVDQASNPDNSSSDSRVVRRKIAREDTS